MAGRTETYCSASEALIELNSGPEEFCSSTAKQLTTQAAACSADVVSRVLHSVLLDGSLHLSVRCLERAQSRAEPSSTNRAHTFSSESRAAQPPARTAARGVAVGEPTLPSWAEMAALHRQKRNGTGNEPQRCERQNGRAVPGPPRPAPGSAPTRRR